MLEKYGDRLADYQKSERAAIERAAELEKTSDSLASYQARTGQDLELLAAEPIPYQSYNWFGLVPDIGATFELWRELGNMDADILLSCHLRGAIRPVAFGIPARIVQY